MRYSRLLRASALLALPLLAVAAPLPAAPAAAAAAGAAAPASLGTIVYLKGHDVYVARPDGSGERRLTTNGTSANPWRSPSSADNGIVVAARGSVVYRMDQWGTVLSSFDPPDLRDSSKQPIGGTIADTTISPDGSKITYTYEHFTCPPDGSACRERWVTAVSAATALTPATQQGVAFYDNPSWVTGSRLVLNGTGFDSIHLFDLARQQQFWFHDAQSSTDFHPLFEPTVSRDGTAFASTRGEGGEAHIMISSVNGNVLSGPRPTWPTQQCWTGATSADFASPTFAPDSSALAWAGPGGVWVKDDPLDCSVQETLAVPGARAPYWSNAGLQSTRPTHRFAVQAAPSIKAPRAVRPGVRLAARPGTWSPQPTSLRYQWLRDGRAIPRATAATYQVKKADRRHRLSVRVSVARAGFQNAVATSRIVKVRR
ncbi:hypothetical protein [Pimelobacter sp. 30-1]|uniref:hypothetical protein n=1 Tax=Pimelobacter sp. 30-1 TaxID=2004991 RepID=UPI001C0494BD|nr:hypothetical protein [Pimelobacter sp. 30-1]